jgi:ubiquinone/menaquinone biosynthesis C-methylase UbiE
MNLKQYNIVSVPIFEFNPDGSIKPNPLFHRSWDKLHSRCIEYPYAASKLNDEQRILDVGTAKADKAWIDWLEALPIEVHGTDYDEMNVPLKRMKFTQGDVRKLPYKDNYFDAIMAVSVIEHIGLNDAQVKAVDQPKKSDSGDVEAVRELIRILKPGGKLIMTLPFGIMEGLILNNEARNYTIDSISKFHEIAENIELDYYEYQEKNVVMKFEEYKTDGETPKISRKKILLDTIKNSSKQKSVGKKEQVKRGKPKFIPDHFGRVTWRLLPLSDTKSIHLKHTEGVVCGVWEKTFKM